VGGVPAIAAVGQSRFYVSANSIYSESTDVLGFKVMWAPSSETSVWGLGNTSRSH
jgi:hypothetical protein